VRFAAGLLALALLRGALAAGEPAAQSVTPVAPGAEQRVEALAPPNEQHVEVLDADGLQKISNASKSPFRRTADAAAKVVVGVSAFAIAVGVTVASLLLF
jgi:hypothetical protein